MKQVTYTIDNIISYDTMNRIVNDAVKYSAKLDTKERNKVKRKVVKILKSSYNITSESK